MPTVTLNKATVKKLIGKNLSDEQLQERIPMLGTDLDTIDETNIHVEIFPNRPDLLSEQGFARALSSFIGVNTGLAKFHVERGPGRVIVDASVGAVRPHTTCAIVRGLKLDEERLREIIQIQEKLHVTFGRNRKKCAIGIYPLDKITLPIRYLAKKPADIRFAPLDGTEMSAKDILERHPKGKEFAHLLEGASVYPLFMDAKGHTLSMPPIINSKDVGKVEPTTNDVFIECSGHDLRTLKECLNMIVTSLADMGGSIESMTVEYADKKIITPDLAPEEMLVDMDYINSRLGLSLDMRQMQQALERMGYGAKTRGGAELIALVPAYRTDVIHQVDLGEDIAIAYGYENFKEAIPTVATIGEESALEKFKNKLSLMLVGLGMLEARTYELVSKSVQTTLMNENDVEFVELANALNAEYNVLRNSVLPSLLNILKHNKHHELPHMLYGFGRVFTKNTREETGVHERDGLAVAIADNDVDFTRIRACAECILDGLGLEYEFATLEHPSFIEGRCAKIVVQGKELGLLGELHPLVLTNFTLNVPAVGMEMDVSRLKEVFELKTLAEKVERKS